MWGGGVFHRVGGKAFRILREKNFNIEESENNQQERGKRI